MPHVRCAQGHVYQEAAPERRAGGGAGSAGGAPAQAAPRAPPPLPAQTASPEERGPEHGAARSGHREQHHCHHHGVPAQAAAARAPHQPQCGSANGRVGRRVRRIRVSQSQHGICCQYRSVPYRHAR